MAANPTRLLVCAVHDQLESSNSYLARPPKIAQVFVEAATTTVLQHQANIAVVGVGDDAMHIEDVLVGVPPQYFQQPLLVRDGGHVGAGQAVGLDSYLQFPVAPPGELHLPKRADTDHSLHRQGHHSNDRQRIVAVITVSTAGVGAARLSFGASPIRASAQTRTSSLGRRRQSQSITLSCGRAEQPS